MPLPAMLCIWGSCFMAEAPDHSEQLALKRLWLLSLLRLSGVFLAAAGVYIVGRQPFGDVSRWVALPLMLLAVVAVLFLPKWLARRWRDQP